MERQNRADYEIVDRIIAQRQGGGSPEDGERSDSEDVEAEEFLVKWTSLGYDQCTWEVCVVCWAC